MKKENILLKWVNIGKKYEKEVDRQALFDLMSSIANAFGDDNQISKKLCEIIPEVDIIYINRDWNEARDIPFIECRTGENVEVVKIIRYHKIIWSILDRYIKLE